MGIFGKLDADRIPDNPFKIDAGEYRALITGAFFQYNEKRDMHQFLIVYTIDDETSKFHGKEARDWFNYYPDMDEATYEILPPAEQRKFDEASSAIKRRLCGVPKLNRKGLGIDPADLTPDWNPGVLLNTPVDIGIVNSGDDNEYTNVQWVSVIED
jgi:hypothetical protein